MIVQLLKFPLEASENKPLLDPKGPGQWGGHRSLCVDCAEAGVTWGGRSGPWVGGGAASRGPSASSPLPSGSAPRRASGVETHLTCAAWIICSLSDQTSTPSPMAPFISLIRRGVPSHRPVISIVLMRRPGGFGAMRRHTDWEAGGRGVVPSAFRFYSLMGRRSSNQEAQSEKRTAESSA